MVQRVPLGYQLGRRTAELGGAFAAQFHQVREFYRSATRRRCSGTSSCRW